jgi:amino acid adenylation domain-containing protein
MSDVAQAHGETRCVVMNHDGGAASDGREARPELLAACVARHARTAPNSTALAFGELRLTYDELDRRANRLAHALRECGAGPDVRVGIMLERGPQAIVAILGVMKAGGAYVPLDPSYPRERLMRMLADSGASLLIADRSSDLPAGPWNTLDLAAEQEQIDRLPASPVAGEAADHLAYVIYTSGSTGTPKGVMVAHRGIPGLAAAQGAGLSVDRASRVLQFASMSFDASVWEMAMAFFSGATLVLAPRDRLLPGRGLIALLREERITHLTLSPSVLALLPETDLPDLRVLVVAGEACGPALVERWAPGRCFINAYGPTETTVCATMGACVPGEPVTIGRAITGVRASVLSDDLRPVPEGSEGELCVGGDGVARGYHGRPGATAERFVPDPSGEPGARLYRTGDRVRVRADGRLEYVGRIDQQVKIRGHRVELGEVEHALLACPLVAAAAVTAYEAADGLRTLRAYVVAGSGGVDDAALRGWLADRLPGHMLPSSFVWIDEIPLTPSGKADRARFPASDGRAGAAAAAPRTETEQALVAIWREVLELDEVGVDRPFLELGGHSLRGTRALSRIFDAFGVEVPPFVLLRSGTIEEIAAYVDGAERHAAPPYLPLVAERVSRDGPIPVSFAQEAAWFFEQLAPGSIAYRAQATLHIAGALEAPVLERAMGEIVRRHEIFRTTFPVEDGIPVQRVHLPWAVHLPVHDLSGMYEAEREAALRERVSEAFLRPFDINRLPLVRWTLVRLSPREHVLIVVEHHFVHDGWSFGVFLRELRALYVAYLGGGEPPLAEPGAQFADFAVWQRRWMESEAGEARLRFWEESLAGVPTLELPTDFPRPAAMRFRGSAVRVELDAALAAEARAFSRERGVTFFVTLFSAFQALLARLSGQRDFCVGSAVGNRGQSAFEGVIGMIVNTLPIRSDLEGDPTVAEFVGRVRDATLRAYEHQHVPFDQVVRRVQPERSAATLPLCQVLFSFHDAPMPPLRFGGLELQVEEALNNGSAKFDLQVVGIPRAEQGVAGAEHEVVLVWEYSTDLFRRETVLRMVHRFETLLRAMIRNPALPVSALELMDDAERGRVVDAWNRTQSPHDGRCIHQLIASQAARTPDAVALVFADEAVCYRELDARANRLARHLARLGAGPEARLGICLERSVEMVVALLAVLKAGAAYLPLDPAYPPDRLAWMLGDAGARIVVTEERLRGLVSAPGVRAVRVDGDAAAIAAEPSGPPATAVAPANAAYVIHTSGSTGRPKGVVVTHANAAAFFAGMDERVGGPIPGTWLAVTRIGFDIHVLELLWTLARGFRVVVHPDLERAREDGAVARQIRRHGVTHLQCTPTLAAILIAESGVEALAGLDRVLLGGEPLPPDLTARIGAVLPDGLLNVYGPTETTVWSTTHAVGAVEGPVSIGRPIANTRVYVLDGGLRPQPVSVPGELCIGGAGVTRGYLDRPGPTAERFVPDPFAAVPGARMYRTGDRARWRDDGTLDCLGRLDQQVKIRGFRIEPGEIEAVLRAHPAVRDCVVAARDDGAGGKRLAAWVVAGGHAPAAELRAHLRARLPEHMVPSSFTSLAALPLTPGGKLDRAALPTPEPAPAEDAAAVPLEGDAGEIARIWAELLGRERVGAYDNFFDLGGDSLLAARVVIRTRDLLRREVSLVSLFDHRTLEAFARVAREAPPLETMDPDDDLFASGDPSEVESAWWDESPAGYA